MSLRKILIVDDEEVDQYICKYVIEKFDPTIATLSAFNGREALDILRQDDPDAIILDINMPIMNGFEFLERYAAEFDNHVPVVAMLTSSIHDHDRDVALRYVFVDVCFQKPLTEDHLAQLANTWEQSTQS
ncbi:response regulator [Cohaesibacter intestini]|uniref:response regulator n=1 Tax=Cohaesibacter intestini TaxID=2211145 RepID=UPI000DE8F5FB|nr:response regulator [Cohaesibacter intestini]